MEENGEDKLIAVARHIAKTLGQSETMTDDILQIFSTFDGRFSREKMSEKIEEDDRRSYAGLDQSLKLLDRQISQYVASDQPVWSYSANSAAFLNTIDELIATIRDWSPMAAEKPIATCLHRADELLQKAMFRLEEEFRLLIERSGESFDQNQNHLYGKSESAGNLSFDYSEEEENEDEGDRIPVAHPVSDYDILIDALPSGTINDLHEITKRMVTAGFGNECSNVYSSYRKEFLEESLSRLGLQKLMNEEVQKMEWSELEEEIEGWMKAANVAFRILFPSERRLCDRIFFGHSSYSDHTFMEICRDSTILLLNFAEAVANGSRSPERLFKVLDVYETLRDLMPEIEIIFEDQYCSLLRKELKTIWKRNGEAIKGAFTELENSIRRDPAKTAVPGGGLHPITRYVMNYLLAACRSRQTLEQVYAENSGSAGDYRVSGDNDRLSSSTSLSVQMAWIMELLESNLEVKSKMHKNSALKSVFLMNNFRYIYQKVNDNELGSLLGEDWIRKHTAKIRQCNSSYHRSSWARTSAVLKLESSNVGLKTLAEKLKTFNMYLDEICRTQSTWKIVDDKLKTELRLTVSENLLPAYQNFLRKFQSFPEVAKNVEKYIRYNVEDIEVMINDLFQGSGGSAGGRK